MQVLIAISGFCPRIGNVPCTTPFDFLFVISIHVPTWGTTLSISTNLFALIFQSTFPRGERHHQPGYHYLLHSFQSTFLCGERRHITRMQLTTLHFNPRSRVGNDGWSYSDRICDRDFNPHSCVGNDTKCEKKLRSYPDFNPRSLVGNDDSKHPRHCFFSISIHFPSWGTTSGSARDHRKDRISIHFPSWGTTVLALLQIPFTMISIHVPSWGTTRPVRETGCNCSISIHVPSWGTTVWKPVFIARSRISIHVPSWGTTSWQIHCPRSLPFQSTFPRGERRWKNLNVRCRRLFQSTFPRGERPDTRKMGMAHTNFNPRSLVGNDPPSAPATDTFVISIHVPSWGTTFFMPVEQLARHISIHVPSWGTTGPAVCDRFSIGLFQSTFPRGERHSAMRNFRSDSYFNPRSLVGNDQSQSSLLLIQEISIHVPSWGTTANFHKYSLFFYAINIIFLLFIIPSLFSLVLFMLLF